MILREFLLKETKVHELCVICIDGWPSTTAWIDHEDLFASHVDPKLSAREVKKSYWGYLPIATEGKYNLKIPCHYIEL